MASGNSSNANRYKGEDIDTDGDGSVNDSQTLQGNQPSDLGNTIDSKTITKNSSGEIQAQINSKTIIGDFESDLGGWTPTTNTGDISATSKSFVSNLGRGVGEVQFNVDNAQSGTNFIENTYDFSARSKLIFAFDEATSEGNHTTLRMKIGGNTKFSTDPSGQGENEVITDVSNISGQKKLTFEVATDGNGSDNAEFVFIDNIRFEANRSSTIIDGEAGN